VSDEAPAETTESAPEPAPARKPRSPWLFVAVAAVLVVVIGLVTWAVTRSQGQGAMADAYSSCSLSKAQGVTLGDNGHTLSIDTKGNDDLVGADVVDAACALVALKAPSSVITDIDQTRALDGKQTATWDGITATWRYHPDNGLQITLTDS
jgi:hypothetical protein